MIRAAVVTALLVASPVLAVELDLPSATMTATDTTPAGTVRLPEAPWTPDVSIPATEGAIRRSVFVVPQAGFTTLQLIAPMRDALEQDGYTQVFSCADAQCGGFDFRFQLDLIGEPDMHVDLGDYRYTLMRKPGGDPHSVAMVASSAGRTGFVHVTEVSDSELRDIDVDPTPPEAEAEPAETPSVSDVSDILEMMTSTGRAVLADLQFGTGAATLNDEAYASLSALAAWLASNPSARIVLVGHTDAVGSLAANTSLSQRRAEAVADRLRQRYGTDAAQVQAAGAGYLAPLSSNLTAEGRAANRRVEVVLLSLEE